LLDHFEDRFGELRAWNGYPFGALPNDRLERVWVELEKKVVTKISRRVVSLASFNRDYSRSFACTGLLIKWPGSGAKRTVVLTSASLVRSRDNEGNIDRNLRVGAPITLGLLSYIYGWLSSVNQCRLRCFSHRINVMMGHWNCVTYTKILLLSVSRKVSMLFTQKTFLMKEC